MSIWFRPNHVAPCYRGRKALCVWSGAAEAAERTVCAGRTGVVWLLWVPDPGSPACSATEATEEVLPPYTLPGFPVNRSSVLAVLAAFPAEPKVWVDRGTAASGEVRAVVVRVWGIVRAAVAEVVQRGFGGEPARPCPVVAE